MKISYFFENFLKNQNKYIIILKIAFLFAFFALMGAYIAEYIFDLQPCILCLYQRKPYFAIVILTLIFLLFKKLKKYYSIAIYLIFLLFLVNFLIAFYHSGVELHLFQGPKSCVVSDNLNDIDNLEDLKNKILETRAIRCDKPEFYFLGLTMTNWNLIYCLIFFGVFFKLKRK
jgi:disulfide bond formation protein DsbB